MIQFLAALAILHQNDLKKKMNRITAYWQNGCFEKWMIIWFTPYQTTNLPKWMFSPLKKNFSSKHPCCKMVSAAFKYIPLRAAMIFAFPSVFIPSSMPALNKQLFKLFYYIFAKYCICWLRVKYFSFVI